MDKNLNNKTTEDVIKTTPDIEISGDPDAWKLVCKVSGKNWMKSTKKMMLPKGYLYLTTSEFRNADGDVTACSDSLVYVPVYVPYSVD